MLGTVSFTYVKAFGSAGFAAASELLATAGGVVGAVCEVFAESCLAGGAAACSHPDSPINPETSNPARIAFVFIGSFSRKLKGSTGPYKGQRSSVVRSQPEKGEFFGRKSG